MSKSYILPDGSGTYLPPHFWYNGMHKIKAGKGYRTGKPIGVIGGKCEECNGNIISIKICTSSKGFETTSEKVCDTCGIVYPGAFQVLDKPEDKYTTRYTDTHEEWKTQNMPSNDFDDIDVESEYWANVHGIRPDETYDNSIHIGKNEKMPFRLWLAYKRLDATPESKKMPMKDWRNREYHIIVDDYIYELGLNKADARDVHYIIEHRGVEYKKQRGTYPVEDVILCICTFVQGKRMSKQQRGGLITRNCSLYGLNKKLNSLVRDKLSS